MQSPILTPDQSRKARREFGLSQADVATVIGVNRVYISDFENGGTNRLTKGQQRKLASLYLEKLETARANGEEIDLDLQDPEAEQATPAPATLADLDNREDLTRALLCVRHFSLSPALDGEQIAAALGRMDENDATIRALMDKPAEPGLFSEWNDVTESRLQEVFGLLAENFLLFRHLQGRALVPLANMTEGVDTREVKTIGDLMATLLSGSLRDMGAALTPKAAPADAAAEPEATPKRVGLLIEGEAA